MNADGELAAALRELTLAQAVLSRAQAGMAAQMVAARRRAAQILAAARREAAELAAQARREALQAAAQAQRDALEAQRGVAQVHRELAELRRILLDPVRIVEALPDAVKERIGFSRARRKQA